MAQSSASEKSVSPGEPAILSVQELLRLGGLAIPHYQRPYKWTRENVNNLFSDIALHDDKTAYRLGTVVLHQEKDGTRNLVDGQQRTLTLLLSVKAMQEKMSLVGDNGFKSPELRKVLEKLVPKVDELCESLRFGSDASKRNLKQNYEEIRSIIGRSDFTETRALYFLECCEVVVFSLAEISEAFQFFDSQNARGKDLDPHDLLKAYHLREFGPQEERGELMTRTIGRWEELKGEQLVRFFGTYWFRIRRWSRGRSARYFSKKDVAIFKGIDLSGPHCHPGFQLMRVAHFFTDHHGRQYERKIDGAEQPFPFQLDQTILNGRRFFEMTSRYLEMVGKYTGDAELKDGKAGTGPDFGNVVLDKEAQAIMQILGSYSGRHRRGDQYVRNLFDCLLLLYIDRFGMEDISRAICRIFLWAYRVRLEYKRIQLATMDNHALAQPLLFQVLRDATAPPDFLRVPLDPVRRRDIKMEVTQLVKLFETLNHVRNDAPEHN